MAQAGDFAGALRWLREHSVLQIPPGALDHLAKAIRKGQANLDGLVDTAYGEAIGFIIILLVRCQLHVEARLAESDTYGGDPTHLPHDLDAEGWLERIEKLTRFLIEVTSARGRVQHLRRLNDAKRNNPYPHWLDATSPMDADRVQAPPGEGASRNGRCHRQEARIIFP